MSAFTKRRREAGVSLIELMIALAIGSLLVLALVEVFAASRTAYQLSAGMARAQENGRFAIDILQRDLRMAGHAGCVNDQARFLPGNVTPSRPALVSTFLTEDDLFAGDYEDVEDRALRFDVAIEGFEAVGTANDDTVIVPATPVAAAAADWVGGMDAAIFGDLTVAGAPVPIGGSDVLVLRYFAPTGAQVTGFTPGNPAVIEFEAGQSGRLTEGMASPGLFAIADCMQAGVFQATTTPFTTPAGTTPGRMTVSTGGLNRSSFITTPPFTGGQSMLYRAESVVYYVALNGNGNPSLYRMRYAAAPGAGAVAITREELVEGIESLQLEFGQDNNTAASQTPTGNIGNSVTADNLDVPGGDQDNAWRRVGLVRVGLLARSTEPAAAAQRNTADGATNLSALGVTFTPPDDTRYRSVYEDTVALRNRLFGN